jgi:hypothetical protein
MSRDWACSGIDLSSEVSYGYLFIKSVQLSERNIKSQRVSKEKRERSSQRLPMTGEKEKEFLERFALCLGKGDQDACAGGSTFFLFIHDKIPKLLQTAGD